MALFELKQEYSGAEGAAPTHTVKESSAADIDAALFVEVQHADMQKV